ncbi:hypothetical protein O181_090076 [Austropuccinia psidii MF-1]|uniref:Uncharacterized protein n=1 Tax=Austropuccinia psidii MF-1 TaxID=1389203 RepID=A0A9Q3IUP1_9BASI|nr:hypothetical protein [Austropuccinia psidii MF-1]
MQRDVQRWTNVVGPILICGRPIYSSSEVPVSKINIQGMVKRIRRIANFPSNPDGEGIDELQAVDKKVIPSTPKNFQPRLSAVPSSTQPSSPQPSTAIPPALDFPMRKTPAPQPRP